MSKTITAEEFFKRANVTKLEAFGQSRLSGVKNTVAALRSVGCEPSFIDNDKEPHFSGYVYLHGTRSAMLVGLAMLVNNGDVVGVDVFDETIKVQFRH